MHFFSEKNVIADDDFLLHPEGDTAHETDFWADPGRIT